MDRGFQRQILQGGGLLIRDFSWKAIEGTSLNSDPSLFHSYRENLIERRFESFCPRLHSQMISWSQRWLCD